MSNTLKNFGKKHPDIKLVYLFGSHAKGRALKESDIDIAILLEEKPDNKIKLKYINKLSKLLNANDIDLVILNNATPLLSFQIIKHGKCVYEEVNSDEKVKYEAKVLNYYLDILHLYKIQQTYIKKKITKGEYFG